MWWYSRSGEILDVKKFEMHGVKDNMIHTVLLWHGWYLCCFIAKSVQYQFTLFCRNTYFVAISRFLCEDKLGPKFCLWRKHDKYDVCPWGYSRFLEVITGSWRLHPVPESYKRFTEVINRFLEVLTGGPSLIKDRHERSAKGGPLWLKNVANGVPRGALFD